MKKIFLLFVCICLAFTVYAGRKTRSKRTKYIQYVFKCVKCSYKLPDYKAVKLPTTIGGKPKCPQCGNAMRAFYVEH